MEYTLGEMLPLEHPEDHIRDFVRRFFKLAAEGNLLSACAMLDEPNSYGERWTAESIQAAVDQTFHRGTRFWKDHPEGPRFSDPDFLAGPGRFEIQVLAEGTGYICEYDVPLNDEWSDLTAQFEFLRRTEGLAAVLHDLHVL